MNGLENLTSKISKVMNMLQIKDRIERPSTSLVSLLIRFWWLFPDKLFLQLRYRFEMGKRLDLMNPNTFNEKLQWLKLYNRKPEYTTMVDKYAVKDYVAKLIGEEYIIPTLGVWDKPEQIEWDKLPNQFVLKTTQGGGGVGVIICKDKQSFAIKEAVSIIRKSLKLDVYHKYREWPYKNVRRRIIAEKLMEDNSPNNAGGLCDYKFTCFDGYVDNVMTCTERNTGDTKFYFFDREWNLLPLNKRGINTDPNFKLPKPPCIDEMFNIASKLSKGIPFLRVDLYCINDRPYFGELTFFPASGFDNNLLPQTEIRFGELIKLDAIKNQ